MRHASLSKPAVFKLRERGVEIRAVDAAIDDAPALVAVFKGVDTVINTHLQFDDQIKLADAAKMAGVNRFVTDDWGLACVRGVRKLYDQVRSPAPSPPPLPPAVTVSVSVFRRWR